LRGVVDFATLVKLTGCAVTLGGGGGCKDGFRGSVVVVTSFGVDVDSLTGFVELSTRSLSFHFPRSYGPLPVITSKTTSLPIDNVSNQIEEYWAHTGRSLEELDVTILESSFHQAKIFEDERIFHLLVDHID
jgi:hypothetical protein